MDYEYPVNEPAVVVNGPTEHDPTKQDAASKSLLTNEQCS